MRRSPLHDRLERAGAAFAERDGARVCAALAPREAEYRAVREHAGLADFSHLLKYRGRVDDALYPLDETLTGNVANLRFGRVLHTLLTGEDGRILADVYVACDDEDLFVLAEPCAPAEQVDALLRRPGSGLSDVTGDLAVLSLDGPAAWGAPRDLFGRDVLGMPYLSVEPHDLDGPVRLIRAGKTAEFGYLVLVDASRATAAWDRLLEAGARHGIAPVGLDVHDDLRLDGRFFNVHREGRAVGDPLELGLQWMIDFAKDGFVGRDAIRARREAGVAFKTVGVALAAGLDGMDAGDPVLLDGDAVGHVVTAGWSFTLGRRIGLARLSRDVAYAGLDLAVRHAGRDQDAVSLSMPPFVPKSLTVRLDEV